MRSSLKPPPPSPLIVQGLYSYEIGGSERVGAQLAIEYAARGYRVSCFAFYGTDGPFRRTLSENGIECIDLDYTTRLPVVRRISYQAELYRIFHRARVHSLHVHHATALMLCGIPARLAGIRNVIMTEHAIHQLQERPSYRRSASRYCKYASAVTAVHPGIAEYFRDEMGVEPERLHVISNGVSIAQPDARLRLGMRESFGLDDKSFVFLYVGRLEAVKDLGTLLKAVAMLPEAPRRPIRVFLAGDGSARAALEALADELGIRAIVTFLGARSDVESLLAMADGFVMTSLTEGLPMALIEAMSAGVPCIATAVGGIPQLFASDAGILVPPGDPGQVAQALVLLATDDQVRRRLSEQGLAKVRAGYGLDSVVTSYLKLMGLPSQWPGTDLSQSSRRVT